MSTVYICVDCGLPRSIGSAERCRQCYRDQAERRAERAMRRQKRVPQYLQFQPHVGRYYSRPYPSAAIKSAVSLSTPIGDDIVMEDLFAVDTRPNGLERIVAAENAQSIIERLVCERGVSLTEAKRIVMQVVDMD